MLSFTPASRRWRRAFLAVFGGTTLLLALLVASGAAFAADPATTVTGAATARISTPYPAMTVQAGQTVSLEVSVSDTIAERLDLALNGVPDGWKINILGAGHPVSAVMTTPGTPASLELQVVVPAEANESTANVSLVATSPSGAVTLPLALTVSKVEGGTTDLKADYDSLKGAATTQFSFTLTLTNNSLQPRTYNLSSTGPADWTLSLTPSSLAQQTPTVTVEAQSSQTLSFNATPSSDVKIGSYDLGVTAAGGGETATVPLHVEVTGTYTLTLTTPQGNLNADVKAGGTTKVQFVVTNTGTGPLKNVALSATPPANWEVSFQPDAIDEIDAGQQQTVTAVFTPAKDAIAGDYDVTLNAKADMASADSDIRVTVKTSTLWGVIGVLIALAAIGILAFVFRRYGLR